MKKFFESLREHSMKEINFKKNKNEVINEEVAGIIKKKMQTFLIFEKLWNKK